MTTDSVTSIPRWTPLARLVDADAFQLVISGVIVLNAIVLGMETYPALQASMGSTLVLLNDIFYIVFLIELVLRILSYGRRPWNFLRSGWNIFDLIVIGGALIPYLRAEAQILRLLRLARVIRLMRFLPDARVLVSTMGKAIPSVFSMLVFTVLILFVYGIIGWSMYGQQLPEQWGNIGQAMLTLFVLLTLENFPTYLEQAQPYNSLTPLFFLSFVIIAVFVVINLVIGIVIGSMEKAREEEVVAQRDLAKSGVGGADAERLALLDQLATVREQLDAIESGLKAMAPDTKGRRT
jgi:voltage-gated sodium channel